MQISQYNSSLWVTFDFESLLSPQNLIQSGFFFRLFSSSGLFGQRHFLVEISFCHRKTSVFVLFGQGQTSLNSRFAVVKSRFARSVLRFFGSVSLPANAELFQNLFYRCKWHFIILKCRFSSSLLLLKQRRHQK